MATPLQDGIESGATPTLESLGFGKSKLKKNEDDENAGSDFDPDEGFDDADGGGHGFPEDPSGQFSAKSDHGEDSHQEKLNIRTHLAKKDSANVFRLRLLVISVLVVSAIVICYVVYQLVRKGELESLESQYEGAAGKVIVSFENIMTRMGSVTALGAAFTSYGEDHKGDVHENDADGDGVDEHGDAHHAVEWPFVTLNNFQEKASHSRHLSGALMVGMSPVITQENFHAWEDYVKDPDNNQWM